MSEVHFGRSWSEHHLEDACPCEKAPCGLVKGDPLVVREDCDQHGVQAARTIRQMHYDYECPDSQPTDQ